MFGSLGLDTRLVYTCTCRPTCDPNMMLIDYMMMPIFMVIKTGWGVLFVVHMYTYMYAVGNAS